MAKYKTLVVWQKANEVALKVYNLTEDFPKYEIFGITSQIRRASLSVPLNKEQRRSCTTAQSLLFRLSCCPTALLR
jgi:four helix bundle protein